MNTQSEFVRVRDLLLKQVDEKRYLDVGNDVAEYLGVSKYLFKAALEVGKNSGYHIMYVSVKQKGTNLRVVMKVLTQPDVTYMELLKNLDKVLPVEV